MVCAGQQAHGKMLDSIRSADQSTGGRLSRSLTYHHQKVRQYKVLPRMWSHWNPKTLPVR